MNRETVFFTTSSGRQYISVSKGEEVLKSHRRFVRGLFRGATLLVYPLVCGYAVGQEPAPTVVSTAGPDQEMTEPLFSKQSVTIKPGAPLTEAERRALQGGVLASPSLMGGLRSVYGLDLAIEQHLTAEVSFAMPSGSLVSAPPLKLTLGQKGDVLTVNGSSFPSAQKSSVGVAPNTYALQLRPGTYLVVRPLRGTDATSLGGLVCVQLDYRYLEGAERLPAEERQLPLLAEQVQFSLTSLAMASHMSGIKPSVIRISLQDIAAVSPPIIETDQGVGRNPAARLIYQPKGRSEPRSLQVDDGALASSTFLVLLHSWTGEEFHTKVTDTLAIRRIGIDEAVSKIVKSALPKRGLLPALECLFVKWERNKQIDRLMNKQSELHKLIREAGG